MAEPTDKAREEFLSEAQELTETLSRSLLSINELQKAGNSEPDPDLVNEAFRAVHTLKSLAGLFGAQKLSELSHRLEDLLDQLRLGKLRIDSEVLDLLFAAVETYWQLLAAEADPEEASPSIDQLLGRLGKLGPSVKEDEQDELLSFEIEPELLAVLSEYEEHRLRSNLRKGLGLFRIRVQFDLATIDKSLEEVKAKTKPHGEVITYLPTGAMTSPDVIELDLLLASGSTLSALSTDFREGNITICEIPRKSAPRDLLTVVPAANSTVPTTPPESPNSLAPARAAVQARPQQQMVRSVSQTVRVDIRRLDTLMNVVGELALVKSALARLGERVRAEGNRPLGAELQRMHRNFDRRLAELQSGILEVRMVPLGQVFERLARVVRQISREMGKEVRLVITGADTEIDKLIVEEISDPLMHIVRNAIDHGIEAKAERSAAGKPEGGTIALNAFQKGNHVVLEVEDDGSGVNERSLIERAVALGAVTRGEVGSLSREEVQALIFLPGLSTRDQATDYSGRGVGMDVVKTNIAKLGGVIDLRSERHIGTKVTITLPITLAIVSALLVRAQGRTYAIPLTSVSEAISYEARAVKLVDGRPIMTVRGGSLPLCDLTQLFGFTDVVDPRRRFVVVASIASRRLGLVVDHLVGQQDIVIKTLGESLRSVRGFLGATELGDQRVALVLDAAALIDEVLSGTDVRDERMRLHG